LPRANFFRPVGAAVVAFALMLLLNPNGIPSQSPRLRAPRYLGNTVQKTTNPNGVAASGSPTVTQPRWG
jgi:hypothetical protein